MYGMKLQNRLAMLGLVVVSVVASSCAGSGAGDKAGGSGEPVVLRMATVNGDLDFTPQIRYLVDRVEDLSGGNLRIDMAYEVGAFAKNAETEVVRGVAGGRFDLGFVGTHVFESLGVDSFQALTAPMLIDSYALERAVIESGITDQMMQGLDDVGVTGLGIMAGALRKPIAVERPLLGPADWRGITFGVFKSEGQEQAIRALATPLQVIGDARDKALRNESIDGFESSLLAYRLNGQEGEAPYVTANVNLWPQTLAVFANPDLLADLTAEQRAWLQQAADDAAARSAALADTDAHSIKIVCDAGARFAEASETDLASIQQALAPVYADLKQDPETDGFIEQIQALKESTTPEPALAIPTGCTGKAPEHLTASEGSAPAHLNGTYRYTITKEDVIKHDMGDPEEYPSTNTVTLEGGKFSIRGTRGGFSGTYTVEKDQITFDVPEFMARFTFTFSVDDDGNLHLTPVQPMDPGDAFEFSVHPWTRIR
jgi:TRAP-type C4-dicarboxylate transport system substrate-binding protein